MNAQQQADTERAERYAAFDATCPGIIGNPFIPHFPLPAQAVFLGAHLFAPPTGRVFEALYGGAAGGGKSDALLMGAAQTAWLYPGSAGVCIRREFTMMMKADSLLRRAMLWWLPVPGVEYSAQTNTFTFPNGSTVEFAHHGHPKDNAKFQGAAYQYVAWDELTHWPDDDAYRWLLSRMRRPAGSICPLRMLAASNPGSAGHAWVKGRFVGGLDINGLAIVATEMYVPARVEDNPHLDREAYIATLRELHPTTREQLLKGNWDAREPSDYFRAEWFGPLLDPIADAWPQSEKISVRWWDLAASEKPTAANTAGVKMSRHVSGVRAIEHCNSFKKTPGARDEAIIAQARLDGPGCVVGIEIEPGSGGVAQFLSLEKRLRLAGFRVAGARPSVSDAEKELLVRAPSSENGKAARCDPVSACLERGYQRRGESENVDGEWYGLDVERAHNEQRDGIRLYSGPWTQAFLDVVEGFPNPNGRMDEADATSGGFAYLEAHAWGQRVAAANEAERKRNSHDVNPSERPETNLKGTDRNGHFRP